MIFVPRADQAEMGKSAIPLLYVWISFNLLSLILLPILVLTFLLSKRVTKRHPSLINVCMTWILSGIYSLLLFFGGRAKPTDPQPSSSLCIAQTSLLYGILPMWSVAIFILMYFILGIVSGNGRNFGRGKMLVMLGAPYFTQFCFSLAALVLSLKHPSKVNREHRFFYCALHYDPLSNAMSIFTFIVCLGITLLEFQLAMLLYRNWRMRGRTGQSTGIDLQLLLRVFAFGVFIFLGMFVDVVSMFSQRSLAPDMYFAFAGLVTFLVFASQSDVLRAWCFWRKDDPIHVSPAATSRGSGWTNLDLESEKPNNAPSDFSASLPSPAPAQLAAHVHDLHGRELATP